MWNIIKRGAVACVLCAHVESLSKDKINVFDASRCSGGLENGEVTALQLSIKIQQRQLYAIHHNINTTTYLI